MSNTSYILRAVQTEREETDLGVTNSYLAAIETQMEQLKELIKENSAKQEEIIALRDGVSIILPQLQISCNFSWPALRLSTLPIYLHFPKLA
jgi:hypothetical protein